MRFCYASSDPIPAFAEMRQIPASRFDGDLPRKVARRFVHLIEQYFDPSSGVHVTVVEGTGCFCLQADDPTELSESVLVQMRSQIITKVLYSSDRRCVGVVDFPATDDDTDWEAADFVVFPFTERSGYLGDYPERDLEPFNRLVIFPAFTLDE